MGKSSKEQVAPDSTSNFLLKINSKSPYPNMIKKFHHPELDLKPKWEKSNSHFNVIMKKKADK